LRKKIWEVRFHGRGGQGAWTASILLAQAGIVEEKNVQSFPTFGPERSGAPITAFTRISDEKIQLHSSIYEPDVVVVLDPTLLGSSVTKGVHKGTKIIVNTSESAGDVRNSLGLKDIEIWTINATDLALKVLGRPITNTAMLGAIAKATNSVKISSLIDVIKLRFGGKIGELNAEIVKKAYKEANNI
jgi:2-oxoacid:acceptor oxidoreductase gamma subunit (pyruvate/2-ketoisovalerate family)